MKLKNIDQKTVEGFGEEWEYFDQSELSDSELMTMFKKYFSIFPWDNIGTNSEGFDLGCGTGRWAKLIAPKVGQIHCIDPSKAIEVAKKNLLDFSNCKFYKASADNIPLSDESMDFGYALGVLHHVPDTQKALTRCVQKLKPKAPFLIYLYYSFENRPFWFKCLWYITDLLRIFISRSPRSLRFSLCLLIAITIYLPLARGTKFAEKLGIDVANIPLSFYRNKSFYTMKTDALDRFGTRLEKRFSKEEITSLMQKAGLENIIFSNNAPYWCAVGSKKMLNK